MTQQKKAKNLPRIVTQVDDLGRKKFMLQQSDLSHSQIDEVQQKLIDTGRLTSTLQGRQQKIDTDQFIGKIQGTRKKKKTEVFYCQVCKLGFKCDLAYITHVNSPSHNRKLGMNMKVSAVSIETIAQKLKKMAEEKNKPKIEKMMEKKMGKFCQNKIGNQNKDKKKLNGAKTHEQIQRYNHKEDEQQNQSSCLQNDLQNRQKKQQKSENQQDIEQKMIKELGLPTKFKSKNKKY